MAKCGIIVGNYNLKTFVIYRTFFVVVLSLSCINGFSQTLKAKLLDFQEQPVVGVKVFYDKSTVFTYTDNNGVFEIPCISVIPNPKLIFYHPNYEIFEAPVTDSLRSDYYLKQRKEETKALNNSSTYFTAEEMYQVFRENFLGRTGNTKKIAILNKEVIQLDFDTINHSLSAKAFEALQVQNNALGYHIEYYLKDFKLEYSANTLDNDFLDFKFYDGYSLFKDIDNTKTKQRKKAYEGTINHFFKNIIQEDFKKIKSKVFADKKRIRLKKLFNVREIKEGIYKLQLKSEMLNHQDDGDFILYIQPHHTKRGSRTYYFSGSGHTYYKNKSSTLALYRPYILVDKYGNALDKEYFGISGEILDVDLADLLPIEYHSID